MPKLQIESGAEKERVLRLEVGRKFFVGRDPGCTLCLSDQMVSRVHAEIVPAKGNWVLVDRQSANGTLVNDTRVDKKLLAPGDLIRIGETLISFLSDEEDPHIGCELAGYRLEKRLGRGAMGTVYRATQLSMERAVALKILAPRYASDPQFVRRFIEEAQAAGRLNHPNVVAVYDVGRTEDPDPNASGEICFMSMEYMPLGSVQERQDREGPIPYKEALRIVRDAARALVWSEEQGIVHRDIKPANLLVAADGTVKVGDLGIATDLRRVNNKESKGSIEGSPRYMAPEQARGDAVDHRADIYALGATLYSLLAGKPPFEGESVREILRKKLRAELTPIDAFVSQLPIAVCDLVETMMAPDVEERFYCADEVIEAIDEAQRAPPPPPTRAGAPGGGPRRRPRRSRARQARARRARSNSSGLLVLAVGLPLVLLAVFLVPRILREGSDDTNDPKTVKPVKAPENDQPALTKPDPAEVERQATRALGTLRAEYVRGDLRADEFKRELERFLKEHPDAKWRSRVELVAKEAEKERAAIVARERGALLAQVKAAIDQGDFIAAVDAIDRFERTGKVPKSVIEAQRTQVIESATKVWETTRGEIDEQVAAGNFKAAQDTLQGLAGRLPPALASAYRAKRDEVDTKEAEYAERAKGISILQERTAIALAYPEWQDAAAILKEFVPKLPAGNPEINAEVGALNRDVEAAKRGWAAIRTALTALGRKSDRISLPDEIGRTIPENFPGKKGWRRVRVRGLVGNRVLLGGTGKESAIPLAILDLPPEVLVAVGTGKAGGGSLADIGWLLTFVRGPKAGATVLFGDLALSVDAQEALTERLAGLEKSWFRHKVNSISAREEALSQLTDPATQTATGDDWTDIVTELGHALRVRRVYGASQMERENLREKFLKAELERLRRSSPAVLFNADRVKLLSDSAVKLHYDFSTAAQARDFFTIGTDSQIEVTKAGHLRVRGECRLLRGKPFVRQLAVQGGIPGRRYHSDRPNVNLALWTKATDVVTPKIGGSWKGSGLSLAGSGNVKPTPTDYVVFGMGYHTTVFQLGGRSLDQVLVIGSRRRIQLPALVLIGGEHDHPIHRRISECVWAESVGSLRGALQFDIQMNHNRLLWKFGRRTLPIDEDALFRLTEEKPRKGSVTIFTNRQEVFFEYLTVTGELNPEWLEEERTRLAEDALAATDGEARSKSGQYETGKNDGTSGDGTGDGGNGDGGNGDGGNGGN